MLTNTHEGTYNKAALLMIIQLFSASSVNMYNNKIDTNLVRAVYT